MDLRQLKDFLEIYNKIGETCFMKCVETFTQRDILPEEFACVDTCSIKFLRTNHKLLNLYVAEQPKLLERRTRDTEQVTADMEKRMKALSEKLELQRSQPVVETPSLDDPIALLF